jgi:uncharacterized membrane protein YjjP (DUF1212 family)
MIEETEVKATSPLSPELLSKHHGESTLRSVVDAEKQEVSDLHKQKMYIDSVATIASDLSGAGCFTDTVEKLAVAALHALEVPCYVRCYPNSIQIQAKSELLFRMRQFENGLSVNIASRSQAVLEEIIHNPEKAKQKDWLKEKVEDLNHLHPVYPVYINFFAWLVSGATVNYLFFQCSWDALGLTVVCSVFTFIAASLMPLLSPNLVTASGFLGGFTAAFAAKSAVSLGLVNSECFTGVVISSMISLVPGVGITIGVADLVSGHMVTGSARLTGALAQSFMQGVAIVCGYSAAAWYDTPTVTGSCPNPISLYFLPLFLPMVWAAWCVMLDAEVKDWPPLCMSALIAWGCWFGLSRTQPPVQPELINVIAAVLIGLFSVICHKYLGISQFAVVVIGIFLLVPGSSSVLSVANSLLGEPQAFGISILLVAVEITAGIGISTILHTLYSVFRHRTKKWELRNSHQDRRRSATVKWHLHLK